jgi:hypothetical protein
VSRSRPCPSWLYSRTGTRTQYSRATAVQLCVRVPHGTATQECSQRSRVTTAVFVSHDAPCVMPMSVKTWMPGCFLHVPLAWLPAAALLAAAACCCCCPRAAKSVLAVRTAVLVQYGVWSYSYGQQPSGLATAPSSTSTHIDVAYGRDDAASTRDTTAAAQTNTVVTSEVDNDTEHTIPQGDLSDRR